MQVFWHYILLTIGELKSTYDEAYDGKAEMFMCEINVAEFPVQLC